MFNGSFIAELDQLLAKHGCMRSQGRNGTIVLTDAGSKEDEGKQSLRLYGRHYGLEEQDFGSTFTYNGRRFKLVGVKPTRPKYPLEIECLGTGKPFKFTAGKSTIDAIVAQRQAKPAAPAFTAKPQAPVEQADDRFASAAVWG